MAPIAVGMMNACSSGLFFSILLFSECVVVEMMVRAEMDKKI